MNKARICLAPFPIARICVPALFILMSLLPLHAAQADAAPPPDPTVAGVGPYQPIDTHVQMMSESVFIEVPANSPAGEPGRIEVKAGFILHNQGRVAEKMQVIFPITRLNFWTTEEALYHVDMATFTVKVNGQAAAVTVITTPPELTGYDMDHGFVPDVRWAAFDVTFPVRQDVLIQIAYSMLNDYGLSGVPAEGFTGIAYILETGAGWYGNIGSADIHVHLPYPVSEEAILTANPGYALSGSEMRWELSDFEPARKDNLEVHVIDSTLWQSILELRSKLQQNPEDAASWADLGDLYMKLGIRMMAGTIGWVNPHFSALTLQARQKTVELRPEWGEAHFKLAEILWLGNPAVQSWLQRGGNDPTAQPSLDDPAIRHAIDELKKAASLGFTGEIPGLNEAFPELKLAPPAAPTGTIQAPAASVVPVSTEATQAPELIALGTPAAQPASNDPPVTKEVIAAVGLCIVIMIGALIYLWRPRRKGIG